MILSFSKITHLHGQPYRVYTSNESHTGTATVHCRDEAGKLMKPDSDTIIILCDNDFGATEQDVLQEYARLLAENKID